MPEQLRRPDVCAFESDRRTLTVSPLLSGGANTIRGNRCPEKCPLQITRTTGHIRRLISQLLPVLLVLVYFLGDALGLLKFTTGMGAGDDSFRLIQVTLRFEPCLHF